MLIKLHRRLLAAAASLLALAGPAAAQEPFYKGKVVNLIVGFAVDNSFDRQNPAGLAVSFVQGTALRVGQKVQVKASAKQPGYLVLLDVTPGGSVTQVYPNDRSLRTPTGSRRGRIGPISSQFRQR